MPKIRIFNSIKNRYFTGAVILLLVIITGAVIIDAQVNKNRKVTSHNIDARNNIIKDSRLIRSTFWDIRESLNEFLLDPYHSDYFDKLTLSIDKSINLTEQFISKYKNITIDNADNMQALLNDLYKLKKEINQLITIRTSPTLQYPSLAYVRGKMLPYHLTFQTATTLALEEIKASINPEQNLNLFLQLKYTWAQMISEFRMHISNRLGSFSEDSFRAQISDITQWYDEVDRLLIKLEKLDAAGSLNFQASMSIADIRAAADNWKIQFEKVIDIHMNGEWRKDTVFIQSNIMPLFNSISKHITAIDLTLDQSAVDDIEILSSTAQGYSRILWSLVLFGGLFVCIGYLILNRLFIKPIHSITEALKAEAQGIKHSSLPIANSVETQNLIDAFSEMQKQVRTRQSALEHQALHDSLTGLANRTLLLDRLEQAINQAHRDHNPVSLCIIDLDHFKEVNDTLGHLIGDVLLEEVGRRFINTLRDIDTVARMGGDEFAIVLPGDGEQEAKFVANKLLETLNNEFVIEGHLLCVGASIGISIYPQHGTAAKSLIQRADVAMYYAKNNKRGYAIYNPDEDKHSIGRLALVSDLNQAILGNKLELYYQPQVDIKSGEVCSVEALLRWNHPGFGWLPPLDIIKLAEENNLINPLTQWILDAALASHKNWKIVGTTLPIMINLSVYNLQDPDLIDTIHATIEKHKVAPENITLEVTETAMMLDPNNAIRVLREIHDMGIKLSIDDYGTGYSSLSYLRQVPADELKIDKSFVHSLNDNDDDAIIVRSTIDLAHNLGLKVVAEGVESEAAWDILEILGCDTAQGFYICTPMPGNKLLDWVHKKHNIKSIANEYGH